SAIGTGLGPENTPARLFRRRGLVQAGLKQRLALATDLGGQRVDDFEILPISLLDRPRVDVTLRVSGFFRDAFANLIRLFDA
ncbi:cobaltochelatase subunit CobN, partial [Pseudomonas sp. K2]|uniref:cobaltochelatase subunit CobN n=1 Tax=Pseudomonas sp. K2 TaxID=212119 RepID=UPI001D0352C3